MGTASIPPPSAMGAMQTPTRQALVSAFRLPLKVRAACLGVIEADRPEAIDGTFFALNLKIVVPLFLLGVTLRCKRSAELHSCFDPTPC